MSDSTPEQPKTIPLDCDREPVTTHHRAGDLEYAATCGTLPLADAFGEPQAGIFYTAYTRSGDPVAERRPLMFSFNGGPGSSSVWLHLGAVGPRRVRMEPDGNLPPPPYDLVENPESWLRHTDLVFIDPVGTGFSRAKDEETAKGYWNFAGDVESIAQFIRLYLSRTQRWSSPLYLVGESYGTTRACGLSDRLMQMGIGLRGIVLVSSILNFQTARFAKGNDLPYLLFLPTYAATAWFHGRLPHFSSLEDVRREAEAFVEGDYLLALHQGSRLSPERRAETIARLARLTGLRPEYLEQTDLRIQIHRFCKELLRDSARTVGRLDSRFRGIDEIAATELPSHDPAMTAIMPPYTACLNDYLGRELGWKTDFPYHIMNPGELWKEWKYADSSQGYPDTSEALRSSLSKNPHMKVMVCSGYYDLATPYYATEYTLAHLGLDATLRENVMTRYYEAGHMMYIDEGCLAQLQRDAAAFLG